MLSLYVLGLCVAFGLAQKCQPLSQILPNPERYFQFNQDEFPTDIYRVFQGSLSKQCDAFPNAFQRDPTLCLPDKSGREKCNLCAPTPSGQFFKYPFWSEFNAIKEESPFQYGGSEKREDVTHCMRCFAWALPYNASLNAGIPLDPASDVIKDSVTVSTRVACADEKTVTVNGQASPQFQQPDAGKLKQFDDAVEALDIANHPCIIFLTVLGQAGQRYCNLADFQQKQQQAAALVQQKEAYIESFVLKTRGEAVNGHKEALMEIPYGQMHLLQARVSAQAGFEGWTADEPLQLGSNPGYRQIQASTADGKFGCSIFEYGMVVASPGQIRTACWLTPMFKDDAARANWIKEERKKEAELQQKAFGAVRESLEGQAAAAEKECQDQTRASDPNIVRFCQTYCIQQARLGQNKPVCTFWSSRQG